MLCYVMLCYVMLCNNLLLHHYFAAEEDSPVLVQLKLNQASLLAALRLF